MPHAERPERDRPLDGEDLREAQVRPHPNLSDRMHNPKDVDPDARAMDAGFEHGGTLETPTRARAVRGNRERTGAPARVRRRGRGVAVTKTNAK